MRHDIENYLKYLKLDVIICHQPSAQTVDANNQCIRKDEGAITYAYHLISKIPKYKNQSVGSVVGYNPLLGDLIKLHGVVIYDNPNNLKDVHSITLEQISIML